MKIHKFLSLFLMLIFFAGIFAENSYVLANEVKGITVEAKPLNTDLSNEGIFKNIDFINPNFEADPQLIRESISLFTQNNRVYVNDSSIMTNVAVVVDKNNKVIKVINKAPSIGQKPLFNESTDITVPDGGFVLLGCDNSYLNSGYKKFLAENFKVGDIIKLKYNNDVITLDKIVSMAETQEGIEKDSLILENLNISAVTDEQTVISGKLTGYNEANQIYINEIKVDVNSDGTFWKSVKLNSGVNYIDVFAAKNDKRIEGSKKSIVIYRKDKIISDENKEVVLWVDLFANAKELNTKEKIEQRILKAKELGITAFAFDVKSTEGYAAYKKNDLSQTPYMTETKNPKKYTDMEIDLLEEFLSVAHNNNMKVYTSFNFFTEGNLLTDDSAVISKYPEWEEVLQAPEDKGELKRVTDSKKNSTLLYVNPANDEVKNYQLKRVEEVLKNYDVDGIVMDRCRYDNIYSDFSDISKNKFSDYLLQQEKSLEVWPDDAFRIDSNGNIIKGKYFYEWLSFRSSVIKDFTKDLKALVDKYDSKRGKSIKLAAYVGSWYESYYEVGVNWADENFIYDDRLNFPESKLYNDEYSKTSYLNYIDFIMIGTYYKTENEIKKYSALGNILTNNKVPLYSSVDISSITDISQREKLFKTAIDSTDGGMIFDMCYIDWNKN